MKHDNPWGPFLCEKRLCAFSFKERCPQLYVGFVREGDQAAIGDHSVHVPE
jgi:hypothetical protein